MARAGDINWDDKGGIYFIGAPVADLDGKLNAGQVYVVYAWVLARLSFAPTTTASTTTCTTPTNPTITTTTIPVPTN